jgi:flavin-binding protein dodecin
VDRGGSCATAKSKTAEVAALGYNACRRAPRQWCAIPNRKENNTAMAKVVKVIELMSQSPKSWEDAAQGAVNEATKTLRNIRSIYVKEFTAEVDGGKITNYRINAKVTFDLERG